MLLEEADHAAFKRWLLPKVEPIFDDAEATVLVDYIVALVSSNDSAEDIKSNCVKSLSDFLHADTNSLVDEVFRGLKDKSYALPPPAPAPPAPIPSIVGTINSQYEPYPSRTAPDPPAGAPRGPAAQNRPSSRFGTSTPLNNGHQSAAQLGSKRKIDGAVSQTQGGQDSHYNRTNGARPLKQTARRGGRTGNAHREAQEQQISITYSPQLPDLPQPPLGPPPSLDLANPMAAAMFFTSVFGIPPPNMPAAGFTTGEATGFNLQQPKQPCEDYRTTGYCMQGVLCPHEHGGAISVPADDVPLYGPQHKKTRKSVRARSSLSIIGPSYDSTNTMLVVERIPHDHRTEQDVRAYFSQFGTVLEVTIYGLRELAVVRFEDNQTAVRAYRSPKPVFDNRFVKVYWHKSDMDMGEPEVEEKIDLEEIAKRQGEKQKEFEERRRKNEEVQARKEEIQRRLDEVNEEIRKVKLMIAELDGEDSIEAVDLEVSQTLANLQAEAENLFYAQQNSHRPSDGHGSRGRGNYSSAGRGRGGYRGRGAPANGFHGERSSVKRLDNRPRRLAVAGLVHGSTRDEKLRQYLINVPDCSSIELHPDQPDTVILTFKERYQADMFLDASRTIPDVGKLELYWIPNDILSEINTGTGGTTGASDIESPNTIGEHDKASVAVKPEPHGSDSEADVDMDVADDVDEWL